MHGAASDTSCISACNHHKRKSALMLEAKFKCHLPTVNLFAAGCIQSCVENQLVPICTSLDVLHLHGASFPVWVPVCGQGWSDCELFCNIWVPAICLARLKKSTCFTKRLSASSFRWHWFLSIDTPHSGSLTNRTVCFILWYDARHKQDKSFVLGVHVPVPSFSCAAKLYICHLLWHLEKHNTENVTPARVANPCHRFKRVAIASIDHPLPVTHHPDTKDLIDRWALSNLVDLVV